MVNLNKEAYIMILAGFILPHPPIILPEIGKGREKEIQKTIDAFYECAKEIAHLNPDTIVVCSPHANLEDEALDHGTSVPLYFIEQHHPNYELIRVGIAGPSLQENYDFGKQLTKYLDDNNKRAIFIASGDLSHKLKEDGPYGFAEEGVHFDKIVIDALSAGDFNKLMNINSNLIEAAAECGLRSFIMMSGVLNGCDVTSKLHSYENTFGVGYAVASFIPIIPNIQEQSQQVKLARYSLEHFVKTGDIAKLPDDISNELIENKAGVFICIKKQGQLRGCIGTISPVTENIAQEILRNAVSTASEDPRFEPVQEHELDELDYMVDVLSPPEPADISQLDVFRYGVIVANEYKRGLLLPNLDGVDTVEQQLEIVRQKAGISEDENYSIERFEVKRYE